MKKNCIECDYPLRGRSDKRFCSDQCRSQFHNRKNRKQQALLRRVNQILRYNRSILWQYRHRHIRQVALEELQNQGFKLNYHTSYTVIGEQPTYWFCYDIGYYLVNDQLVQIVLPDLPASPNT